MNVRVLGYTFALVAMSFSYASAGIVFTFQNQTTQIGAGLDGLSSGTFTVSGLQLFAQANVGLFNATSNSFGINQPASGDDTGAFDFSQVGGSGVAENLTIRFDQIVRLNNIDVSSFGSSDEIQVRVGGVLVATVGSTGATSLGDFLVAANTNIDINTTAGSYGNGWSLDFIEASAVAVPEPSGLAVLGACVFDFLRRMRRKRKNAISNAHDSASTNFFACLKLRCDPS